LRDECVKARTRAAGKTDAVRGKRARAALLTAFSTILLASCTSTPPQRGAKSVRVAPVAAPAKPKEYFSEAAYGVKASPRVAMKLSGLRRGGGRDQVGKPYKVRGRWYFPKEEPGYSMTGKASWYGAAFHGRLTANGEIYDMTHLSAAHPTMPLPSYARVTNLADGSSIIVRVNDRGPYAHGRIIDLSKKAAEMLGFTHSGVANVQVDYVGRAPLEGRDDGYLLASYQPAGSAIPAVPQPSSDVMVAMNGTTPLDQRSAAEKAMDMTASGAQDASLVAVPGGDGPLRGAVGTDEFLLPALGPILEQKPGSGEAIASLSARSESVALAYGAEAGTTGGSAFGALLNGKGQGAEQLFVATFPTQAEARRAAVRLGAAKHATFETKDGAGTTLYVSVLTPALADRMLARAWDAGYGGAFTLRGDR
jgi:rare lipoprotein A